MTTEQEIEGGTPDSRLEQWVEQYGPYAAAEGIGARFKYPPDTAELVVGMAKEVLRLRTLLRCSPYGGDIHVETIAPER